MGATTNLHVCQYEYSGVNTIIHNRNMCNIVRAWSKILAYKRDFVQLNYLGHMIIHLQQQQQDFTTIHTHTNPKKRNSIYLLSYFLKKSLSSIIFLTIVLWHHHRVQTRLCPAIVAWVTRGQDNPLQSSVLSTAWSCRDMRMKFEGTGQTVLKTKSQ